MKIFPIQLFLTFVMSQSINSIKRTNVVNYVTYSLKQLTFMGLTNRLQCIALVSKYFCIIYICPSQPCSYSVRFTPTRSPVQFSSLPLKSTDLHDNSTNYAFFPSWKFTHIFILLSTNFNFYQAVWQIHFIHLGTPCNSMKPAVRQNVHALGEDSCPQ